eukprot:Selendium_serpulae@DN6414_c0_g1_i5.p1
MHSTEGFIVCLNVDNHRFAISWSSHRQRSISLSTGEAEVVAAVPCVKECLKAVRLFTAMMEKDTPVPMVLYVDSTVAIKAIERGYSHKLCHVPTTHEMSMSWLTEVFTVEGRTVKKIHTQNNVADLFTKPLGRIKIDQFCNDLNLQNYRSPGEDKRSDEICDGENAEALKSRADIHLTGGVVTGDYK